MDLILWYRVKESSTGKSCEINGDSMPPKKKPKIILDGEVGASAHDDTIESDNEDGSVQSRNYSEAEHIINGSVSHVNLPSTGDKVDALDSIIAEEY